MSKRSLRNSRLAALFTLAGIALNYPVISLFSRDAVVFGIPLLYAYLYGAWAAIVALTALAVGRRERGGER
ncbi:MAG: hypothetical protein ACM31P_10935 [Actinomycetota bacterium]